jgi:hypothetical protein
MVYQLNIQTIPLTRRSHLTVRFPIADTVARVWYITGATRRPRIRTECLSRLHLIVVDARDMPGVSRFQVQALAWQVLREREGRIVIVDCYGRQSDRNRPR